MSSLTLPKSAFQPLTATEATEAAKKNPLRLPPPRKTREPAPPRRSRRTRADRAAERRPVVSRRMRRVENDLLLMEAAAEHDALPMNRTELKGLFEQRPWRSEWAKLAAQPERAALFRAFSEMEEERQREVVRGAGREGGWGVDGRVRRLLKERPVFVGRIVREVEEQVLELRPGGCVVLRLEGGVDRLVAHGVAQFYACGHRSVDVGRDRVTVIRAGERGVRTGARLVDIVGC